ncbi:MAG: hypothetical protein ACLFP0_10750 [Rhodosalinus sp.]
MPRKQKTQEQIKSSASAQARKTAAVILEVMAGVRTTGDAAQALGVSTARYYVLETRALEAVVEACEPRARGPGQSPELQIAKLQQEIRRLEGEVRRHQALARLSQRAVGLNAPKPQPPKSDGKARRKRKPTARALSLASRLESSATQDTRPPTQSAAK